jgi:hypothetical protein
MARGGVTFTEVEEAARYLQGLGKNPTVDAIREKLGTGSRTTLAEHLTRWKALQADGEGRLPPSLLALVTGLWESLQRTAEQRIQENQSIAQQEADTLRTQLNAAQQTETRLNQTVHQLQEKLDAEQRAKLALATQWQAIEKSYDKLNTAHQSALKQLENAKEENHRLHQLASQIQDNLEHYQQAVQQQQLEQNLAKERQHAMYTQELAQQKSLLEETTLRLHESEKRHALTQIQLEQLQKNHNELINRYEPAVAKNQEREHAFLQLEAQAGFQKELSEKSERDLLVERDAHSRLRQQVSILTEQLQIAQAAIQKAKDKIDLLRQEKLFIAQEKARFEGALKQLQENREKA